MKLPEETIMAYVDGELDEGARADVDAAMARDTEVRAQVQAQLDLRAKLQSAFNKVLQEPVPDRLSSLLGSSGAQRREGTVPSVRAADVADLASARARKAERATRRAWSLPQFGAIAASLVLGVILGQRLWQSPDGDAFTTRGGALVASGALDEALTHQLASAQADTAPVHIGVTYRNDAGAYCRTFVVAEGASAGVACRSNDAWRVEMLSKLDEASAHEYRTARSALPDAVRQAVEGGIAGEPLGEAGEKEAMQRGWQ